MLGKSTIPTTLNLILAVMRYSKRYRRIDLEDEPEENVIQIDQEDFFLEFMDTAEFRPRGGNSSVFRAVSPEGETTYIIKFCKYPLGTNQKREQQRLQRFEREIEALTQASRSEFADCVIRIIDQGVLVLPAEYGTERVKYYAMEEADSDLTRFLIDNDLTFPQQVFLCSELLRILKGLHALGIYHRDIKADNILMRNGRPIFGDLGLINYRTKDHDLDVFDERVGPFGFLSPEATNKCLGLRSKPTFSFDCWIDEKSDVFQLGQVFWLVLQHEVATGHLSEEDIKFPRSEMLGTIIRPMLQYGKERRASISAVELALEPILKELAIA